MLPFPPTPPSLPAPHGAWICEHLLSALRASSYGFTAAVLTAPRAMVVQLAFMPSEALALAQTPFPPSL